MTDERKFGKVKHWNRELTFTLRSTLTRGNSACGRVTVKGMGELAPEIWTGR